MDLRSGSTMRSTLPATSRVRFSSDQVLVPTHRHWLTVMTGKFELVTEPSCTNVCFWYLPPSVRGEAAAAKDSKEWRELVHRAPVVVKQRAQEKGSFMVRR